MNPVSLFLCTVFGEHSIHMTFMAKQNGFSRVSYYMLTLRHFCMMPIFMGTVRMFVCCFLWVQKHSTLKWIQKHNVVYGYIQMIVWAQSPGDFF